MKCNVLFRTLFAQPLSLCFADIFVPIVKVAGFCGVSAVGVNHSDGLVRLKLPLGQGAEKMLK